jgi:1-deoxy-D-xylulose-5-phosphate synthase
MVLPDRFIDHDAPTQQYDQARLNARHITETALAALGRAARPIPVAT